MLLVAVCGFAQFSANSPYSRFGLGDPMDGNFMALRGMGGIAGAYADPYNINTVNPASYGFLDVTSFDIGVFAKYTKLSDSDSEVGLWNGNLNYLSIAFPLSNPINEILDRVQRKASWGMGFTLAPHTAVGYNVTTQQIDPEFGATLNSFIGSGGTYKFMWGNAYRREDFSIGVNLGYLFGNIDYAINTEFVDLDQAFQNEFLNEYSVKGFIWNAGLMYSLKLNKEEREKDKRIPLRKINFGLYGNSASGFSTLQTELNQNVYRIGTTVLGRDTLSISKNNEGKGKLPAELGFGVMYYHGKKYSVGVNYATTLWSSYENDANPESLSDTYKISVGGSYRPNYNSFNNYFKRVHYRMGLYYGTDPQIADQDQITNYGLSIGMGLPFIYQRKISHANLGLEFGRRGQGTPIEETFAKINFSFTFNDDEWFIKRKYD